MIVLVPCDDSRVDGAQDLGREGVLVVRDVVVGDELCEGWVVSRARRRGEGRGRTLNLCRCEHPADAAGRCQYRSGSGEMQTHS